MVRALRLGTEHHLEAVCATSADIETRFSEEFPNTAVLSDPMSLVTKYTDSALVLAGFSDEELAAARQFIEVSEQPLIVLTDASHGPARLFELMAAWQDAPGRIAPIFVSGGEELVAPIRSHGVQPPARLQVTRTVKCNSLRLNQSEVDRWLFQDLAWITQIEDDFQDVSTLETGISGEQVEETTVKFTTTQDVEITWTIRTGPADQLTTELRSDEGAFHQHSLMISDDHLTREMAMQHERLIGSSDDPWERVIRLGQLGATARRSATRRRTLPIHHEEVTERSQFKSQMAAVGCFVLLWTMFGVIGLMTFGAVVDPRDREMRISSSAGFVLNQSDFDEVELTPSGVQHLTEVARQWSEASPVLLIESESAELDEARKAEVMAAFAEWEVHVDSNRVSTRELPGRWFETVMWVGWVVVFFPLVIAILGQGFILLTQ